MQINFNIKEEGINFNLSSGGFNFKYILYLWTSDNEEWVNLKNAIQNNTDYKFDDGGNSYSYVDYNSVTKTLELYSEVSGSGGNANTSLNIKMDPTLDIYKDMMSVIDDVIEHGF